MHCLLYTTNAVEDFHRQVIKYAKSKGTFTSENALSKLLGCTCQRIKAKWNRVIVILRQRLIIDPIILLIDFKHSASALIYLNNENKHDRKNQPHY